MAVQFFRLDEAFLIAVWVEAVLYGLYVPLFFACMYVLVNKRRTTNIDKPMLFAALLMFCLATAHVSLALARAIEAFIINSSKPLGSYFYIANIGLTLNVVMEVISVLNSFLADCVIVYRCYIVWGKNPWVVAVPIITLFGIAATALYGDAQFTKLATGDSVFVENISRIATIVFSSSLGWQIVISSLIAGRLWSISRRSASVWGSGYSKRYTTIVRLVVESAFIYCMTLAVFLILYLLHHNAEKIVFNSLVQVAAICPTLIIVRVGLRLWEKPQTVASSRGQISLKPVAISVSHAVHTDAQRPTESTFSIYDEEELRTPEKRSRDMHSVV